MVRSVSGCVKNSFRQERIGHQQLEVRHGIIHPSLLHHDLGHVQRCERSVESAVKFDGIPCLRVCQPTILLGIAKAKFYLEPGSVKIQDFLTRERRVGGEEQFVFLVRHNPDGEAYLALQGLGIGQQRVCYPWQSIDEDRQHSRHVEFLQVYLPVNHLGSSPLATPLSLVQIAQVGIVAKTADEMEAVLMDAVIKSTCGEECVGNDEVGQLQVPCGSA